MSRRSAFACEKRRTPTGSVSRLRHHRIQSHTGHSSPSAPPSSMLSQFDAPPHDHRPSYGDDWLLGRPRLPPSRARAPAHALFRLQPSNPTTLLAYGRRNASMKDVEMAPRLSALMNNAGPAAFGLRQASVTDDRSAVNAASTSKLDSVIWSRTLGVRRAASTAALASSSTRAPLVTDIYPYPVPFLSHPALFDHAKHLLEHAPTDPAIATRLHARTPAASRLEPLAASPALRSSPSKPLIKPVLGSSSAPNLHTSALTPEGSAPRRRQVNLTDPMRDAMTRLDAPTTAMPLPPSFVGKDEPLNWSPFESPMASVEGGVEATGAEMASVAEPEVDALAGVELEAVAELVEAEAELVAATAEEAEAEAEMASYEAGTNTATPFETAPIDDEGSALRGVEPEVAEAEAVEVAPATEAEVTEAEAEVVEAAAEVAKAEVAVAEAEVAEAEAVEVAPAAEAEVAEVAEAEAVEVAPTAEAEVAEVAESEAVEVAPAVEAEEAKVEAVEEGEAAATAAEAATAPL